MELLSTKTVKILEGTVMITKGVCSKDYEGRVH